MTDRLIIYQNGLPPAHFEAAAELYESAFGDKFSRAIAERERRVSLIRNGFNPDFAITAFNCDRLVGLAGYHSPDGSLTDGITARAILRRIGFFKGIKACFIFSFYDRKPSPGELVMDGIVVHPSCRGQGIGTELLKRIVSYAEDRDYNTFRLDVIDSNPSARKLYQRFGFKVTKEERFPFLAPILGFRGSATMEYQIAES